ncbi:hypothetical protein ACN6LF_004677 [[Kitasatospora] papulosa]|uniref:hypothetical protein n=1 Tax=[Kitasatospora] papulosa TaxID=1464011 RepID=UPI001688BF6F|nr:hypothetical protein [Streptomyces pratensis]
MVSDLLHEPSAPAVVPSPTRTHAVRASAACARSTNVHDPRQREAQPQRVYRLTDEQKQRLADMQEEQELAGIRAWNRRPCGYRTDQELTRLIATGPVEERHEDKAAVAAEATERALQE